MRRREFIAFAAGATIWPLTVQAQQTPTVGLLRGTKAPEDYIDALRGGLGQSGYVDGKNVTIDIRDADGKRERLSELTADLVRRRVAAIVANTDAVVAAIAATKTIPIVFVTGSDPVTAGFVRNLNRPGGNVTGVSFFSAALASKRLEILRELVPQAGTIALLVDPNFIRTDAEVREIGAAARRWGLKSWCSRRAPTATLMRHSLQWCREKSAVRLWVPANFSEGDIVRLFSQPQNTKYLQSMFSACIRKPAAY
jgi:putative tryptophan/tyrosine transport system substrate-binding protein